MDERSKHHCIQRSTGQCGFRLKDSHKAGGVDRKVSPRSVHTDLSAVLDATQLCFQGESFSSALILISVTATEIRRFIFYEVCGYWAVSSSFSVKSEGHVPK